MKSQARPTLQPGHQGGFTIVEIVMTFIIIGILTAVLVPTLTSRSNDARKSAAEQDLQHLADAEERAAVDTGYLYRLYVLNDARYGDGEVAAPKTWTDAPAWPPRQNERDHLGGIRDNGVTNNNLYTNPSYIFIQTGGGNAGLGQDFLDFGTQQQLFTRLTGTSGGSLSGNLRAETDFNWNGPYVNWSRDANHNDWPDDPWGNDYLFFTRKGVIYPPVAPSLSNNDSDLSTDTSFQFQSVGPYAILKNSSGAQTRKQLPASNIFDRPTLLSLGPNGVPGSGTDDTNDSGYGYGNGDDIVRTVGGN